MSDIHVWDLYAGGGVGGAHMFDHVCWEELCLIQEPGNMSSFPPLARQACVSWGSARCDRLSLPPPLLCHPLVSLSLFSFPLNPAGLRTWMLFQLQSRNLPSPAKTSWNAPTGIAGQIKSSWAFPEGVEYSVPFLCIQQQQNLPHDALIWTWPPQSGSKPVLISLGGKPAGFSCHPAASDGRFLFKHWVCRIHEGGEIPAGWNLGRITGEGISPKLSRSVRIGALHSASVTFSPPSYETNGTLTFDLTSPMSIEQHCLKYEVADVGCCLGLGWILAI